MGGKPVNGGPGSGGRRIGAGRKPTGGRQGASVKELKAEARGLLRRIVGTRKDPLMYLINLAADETAEPRLRLEAASLSIRFIHPSLSAVAVQQTTIHQPADNSQLLEVLSERLGRLAPREPQALTISSEVIKDTDLD